MPKDQEDIRTSSRSRTSSTIGHGEAAAVKRHQASHPSDAPARRQSKWSEQENRRIIEDRGNGMKWEDVSRRLPGRSPTACRLHYQNYLERQIPWNDIDKDKLARLYERFREEIWSPIGKEMGIPWRTVEALHWEMGEDDMARRVGKAAFSKSGQIVECLPKARKTIAARSKARKYPSESDQPPDLITVHDDEFPGSQHHGRSGQTWTGIVHSHRD